MGIMIKLRDYQKQAIESIYKMFDTASRQYIVMPTGSGKTITFLSYASQYHDRILIIVPSKELMKQVYETSLLFYNSSEISRRGDGHNNKIAKVHICIIHSIRGDYLEFLSNTKFDLTIIDEAHHTQSNSYRRFIRKREKIFDSMDMKILGVTATPDRSDALLLTEILDQCSFEISITDLINRKHLSDIEGFSVKTNIDISDVHDHNGDFSLAQLYKKLSTDSRNGLIVDMCKKEMKNRKTLIFCINIKHSKEINFLLNKFGIPSSHIDGNMNSSERNSILSSFRNGEINFLCNCQLLTEGFDEPSIDGIILARPTRSRALFLQMIGRGLRTYQGKSNCKIIDITDNHKLLAGFNDIVEDVKGETIEKFKSIKDIFNHVEEIALKVTTYFITRADFFKFKPIESVEATDSQIKKLKEENIEFYDSISLNEASFLIWYHKIKKEYYGNNNSKKT